MARAPGGLHELGAQGAAAWSRRVKAEIEAAQRDSGGAPIAQLDPRSSQVRAVDWPAMPIRTQAELGIDRAMQVLDWRRGEGGDTGRARHQDEYAEWRVVRRGGRAVGFELTTELPEYWEVLAAYEPERTRALVAGFAGRAVELRDLYPGVDPTAPSTTPEQRRASFASVMFTGVDRLTKPRDVNAPASPYNDGRLGICCLVQSSNTLAALLRLVATALRPCLVVDPVRTAPRYPSGSEVIAVLGTSACDGRHSDPLLVERIVRFATDGRDVGLDDPPGVYIRQVQHHELRLPSGAAVPPEWFILGRGERAEQASDGRSRCQRLTFMLPSDAGLSLDDLVIARTGESLRYGGQLAELVELAVYLRVSDAQTIELPVARPAPTIPRDRDTAPAVSWRQLRAQEAQR